MSLFAAADTAARGADRLAVDAARHLPTFSADECLKCNVCTTVCPVARVTDLFPGPKYVGPQAQRFRYAHGSAPQAGAAYAGLDPTPDRFLGPLSPDHSVDYCSGCGICTRACPADVRIAEINNRSRAAILESRRPRRVFGVPIERHLLRNWFLGQTDLLGRLGVPTASLANASLRWGWTRRLFELFGGIHRDAPLPPFARASFRARWRRDGHPLPRTGTAAAAVGRGEVPPPDRAVVYFHGCAANYQEPRVAEAAAFVLARNGFEVIVPEQVCCGLPLISNGYYAEARRKAARNVTSLGEWAMAGYRIVATSTSCGHTLKAEYREMLDVDDDTARFVARSTWDIMEFLAELHEAGRLDTRFGTLPAALPYHAPCQLKSHGVGLPALDLLALVPGLRAIDLEHDCCGIAGTYGLKTEKYDIAMAVGAPLFARIAAFDPVDAPETACDSETCRWQIASATGRPSRHPVEFLADAYRAFDTETAGAA